MTYTQINVASNGNIQFQSASTSYVPGLFGAGDAALSPFISFYYSDLYPMNAGAIVYSTIGTSGNRQFILRVTNVAFCCAVADVGLSVDVVLSERTNTIEFRYYSIVSSTRLIAIGIENVVSDGVYDYIAINNDVAITTTMAAAMQGVGYTFTPLRAFTGGNLTFLITPVYNVTTYQVAISPAPAAINLGLNAMNMSPTDDAVTNVVLGFNFVFWNVSYSAVNIGANGNIQFSTTSTSYVPGLFGTGSSALAPFIAFFYADLYPNYAGQRSYVTLGTAPARQFVLRISDVYYCCSQQAGQGLTMDVILSETINTIDLRYYNIPVDGTHLVDIGIESSTLGYAEWIAIWNDRVLNSNYAATLHGQNVRFAPTYNYNPPIVASSSSATVALSSSAASSTGASSSASFTSSPVIASSSARSSSAAASSTAVPSTSVAPSLSARSSSTASVDSSSLPTPAASSSSSGGAAAPIEENSSSSNSLSAGAIAGIVIGVIVGVLLMCLVAFCLLFRNTGDKFSQHTDANEYEASHVHGADDGEAHDVGEVEMETV